MIVKVLPPPLHSPSILFHFTDTTVFRIEFEATTCKDYYLVPGCSETFIPAGKTVYVFGQLRNKRWRCMIRNYDHPNELEISSKELTNENASGFPLIGSIPSTIIAELNDGIGIIEPKYGRTTREGSTVTDIDGASKEKEHIMTSICKCGQNLPPTRNSFAAKNQSCTFCEHCTRPSSIQTIAAKEIEYLKVQRFPSRGAESLSTLPESPTEETIAEMSIAFDSLSTVTHIRDLSLMDPTTDVISAPIGFRSE